MLIKNNMKKICLTCLSIILFTVMPSDSMAKYNYINISNPFIRKIPIAIPFFKSFTGSSQESLMSKQMSELMGETLAFTGYFKILDKNAYLESPHKSGITATNINFRNWTVIGAELLITAGILTKENNIKMEFRLYDTFKMKFLVGKQYEGKSGDQRKMVRRFCSSVIFELTGSRGYFNSKIAFISTGTGNKEIYICDFDGYSPKKFTNSRNITLFPAWSSDGKWLAYTSYMKGHPDLYIRKLTRQQGIVVAKKGINSSPAWTPEKFELAATFSFTGDQDIYQLTGKGKITKRLTRSRGIDSSPSWAPDGKKITFVSKRSGTPQIYIKDLISGEIRRLTFKGKYNTQPAWAPDGKKIVYSSMTTNGINICIINTDGNHFARLTEDTGDNESPSWSSDGSLIAFSTTREGASRIYIMTANGAEQRRLLLLPGQQTSPAWSPEIFDN